MSLFFGTSFQIAINWRISNAISNEEVHSFVQRNEPSLISDEGESDYDSDSDSRSNKAKSKSKSKSKSKPKPQLKIKHKHRGEPMSPDPEEGESETGAAVEDIMFPQKRKKNHVEVATRLFCRLLSKCILNIDILILMR